MVKYDLHLLGWYAFQQLCLTITREILGQTVEAFLESNDAGKDGAFSGTWNQGKYEDLKGEFVIQCKFTSKADKNLTLSDLKDEFEKVKTLVLDQRCDNYILITNAGISGRFHKSFNEKLKKLGVKSSRVFGSTWINSQIQESKRLRMMVPRVYGLGDLSQIMDQRTYSQAKQLLASMRDDLSKIVITSAYHKAAKALNDHGFVLIIGEPAAGKTTIATLLAMASVDQSKLSPAKLKTADSVIKHWNPEDPTQFFWIDDAFGPTQYESDLVSSWNHAFPQVKTMLGQGVKIVLTSRDYIYRRARNDLKEGAFPLLKESQVVIDVHKLALPEKEQILYNHLKLGRQPANFLSEIKPYLTEIAKHNRFIPETARRLGDPTFTKELYMGINSLMNFVEKQESFLEEVLKELDKHNKAALALIYLNNGILGSPLSFGPNETETIKRLGSDEGNCIVALEAMKDSLVQYTFIEDNAIWRFKHPTIGDAYSAMISKSPEQLEIYLKGADIEKVMDQITCGDVGLEKAIIVPKPMFPKVLKYISLFKKSEKYKVEYLSRWGARRKVNLFLARRSAKDFLEQYLAANVDLIDQIIKPSLSFYYSDEIDLVVRLHELGLLPEEKRKSFVEYIAHFTISGEDMYLLNDDNLQSVFKNEEMDAVIEQIVKKLIPNLSGVRIAHENSFKKSNKDTAEEHMEDFIERLNTLQNKFENNQEIVALIQSQVLVAKNWIDDNSADESNELPERIIEFSDSDTEIISSRSIFDDIDTHE